MTAAPLSSTMKPTYFAIIFCLRMPDALVNKNNNQPSPPAIRAYLGGSFNPIHNGHIQMAMHVYNTLLPIAQAQQRSLSVSLLPNARSPFKQKTIAPEHRLAMLKLATKDTPLQVSELELWQSPPVYSIDSVHKLKQQYPNDSLIFIMGMDSLRSLDKWKDGLRLTDYVHLWVFERISPDKQLIDNPVLHANLPIELQSQMTKSLSDLITVPNRLTKNAQPLKSSAQGRIYIDSYPIATISSTLIRKQFGMPLQNARLIDTQCNSLIKLLNPAVCRYIIAHQLYSAA